MLLHIHIHPEVICLRATERDCPPHTDTYIAFVNLISMIKGLSLLQQLVD